MMHLKLIVFVAIVILDCLVCEASTSVDLKDCKLGVRSIRKVETFRYFTQQQFWWDGTLSKRDINRCLRSSHGLEDIQALNRIVEQIKTVHSVCEPDFIDQLIEFDRQLRGHVRYSKIVKRKQIHRLLPFFRLLAGQVALTCKESLEKKLIAAEEENKELAQSIELLDEEIARIEADKKQTEELPASKSSSIIFDVASELNVRLRSSNQIESLIIDDSFFQANTELSIGITLSSEQAVENFIKTRQACQLIDLYARSSFYPITRMAWKGYIAKEDGEGIDAKLKISKVVQKWIKAAQYCQGLLIIKAHLDLKQDVPVKLKQDVAQDKQMIILDATNYQCIGSLKFTQSTERKSVSDKIGLERCDRTKWHRFEQIRDTFSEFNKHLVCYTFKNGVAAWLARRIGKHGAMLSKFLKLKSSDESLKRSIEQNFVALSERDVKFAGSHVASRTAAHAGSHFHFALFGHTIPTWEAILIIIACLAVVAIDLFVIFKYER